MPRSRRDGKGTRPSRRRPGQAEAAPEMAGSAGEAEGAGEPRGTGAPNVTGVLRGRRSVTKSPGTSPRREGDAGNVMSPQERRHLCHRSPSSVRCLFAYAEQTANGVLGRAQDVSEGAGRGDVPGISLTEAPASRRDPHISPRPAGPRCVRTFPYMGRESANAVGWALRGCDAFPRKRIPNPRTSPRKPPVPNDQAAKCVVWAAGAPKHAGRPLRRPRPSPRRPTKPRRSGGAGPRWSGRGRGARRSALRARLPRLFRPRGGGVARRSRGRVWR